ALRREWQREPDVEAAEEPRGDADELVVVPRDCRERPDAMPADPVLAPEAQHVELDRALLARQPVDDAHLVERPEHRGLRDLDRLARRGGGPRFDHVPGGRSRTVA